MMCVVANSVLHELLEDIYFFVCAVRQNSCSRVIFAPYWVKLVTTLGLSLDRCGSPSAPQRGPPVQGADHCKYNYGALSPPFKTNCILHCGFSHCITGLGFCMSLYFSFCLACLHLSLSQSRQRKSVSIEQKRERERQRCVLATPKGILSNQFSSNPIFHFISKSFHFIHY